MEESQSKETVRDVLEERLRGLLEERIGGLLTGSFEGKSRDAIISELAGELVDEAVSALGIREGDLNEPWYEDYENEEKDNEEKESSE